MSATQEADAWNAKNPVGTYGNLTNDSGEVCTRVRSPAYVTNSGHVVAFFEGVSGCYLANRFHRDATND